VSTKKGTRLSKLARGGGWGKLDWHRGREKGSVKGRYPQYVETGLKISGQERRGLSEQSLLHRRGIIEFSLNSRVKIN